MLSEKNVTDEQREQAAADLRIAGKSLMVFVVQECEKGKQLLYNKRLGKAVVAVGLTKDVLLSQELKMKMHTQSVQEISIAPSPESAREFAEIYLQQGDIIETKKCLKVAYKANRLDPFVCCSLLRISLDEVEAKITKLSDVHDILESAWQSYDATQDGRLKEQLDRALSMIGN